MRDDKWDDRFCSAIFSDAASYNHALTYLIDTSPDLDIELGNENEILFRMGRQADLTNYLAAHNIWEEKHFRITEVSTLLPSAITAFATISYPDGDNEDDLMGNIRSLTQSMLTPSRR